MSERGSFVTEYIYCDICFEAAKKVLNSDTKYLKTTIVPHWGQPDLELPIIAGKIGGLGLGDEFIRMKVEIIPKLERVICHKLRIALLSEQAEEFFTVLPKKEKKV